MKKNYPRYLLLLSQICLSIVLIAQEDDPFPIQVPDLDTLHFPVWPGCYRSDLSEQAQYLCTCKQMAALIYPHVNWPEESLIDSGYLKIMIYVNRDGTIGPIQLFRKTNHWLDAEVLKKSVATLHPMSGVIFRWWWNCKYKGSVGRDVACNVSTYRYNVPNSCLSLHPDGHNPPVKRNTP